METNLLIHNADDLKSKIHIVRGLQVMLDSDLAEIYGYSTKRFNEQVKNNKERFDEDFMFQLTKSEHEKILRSKFLTLESGGILRSNFSTLELEQGKYTKYLPYAFTEQGIYMLMTVLKGDLAVQQSKALIRIFKQMKDFIVENQNTINQRDYLSLSLQTAQNTRDMLEIRQSLSELDEKVADSVDKIGECVTKSELSNIFLDFSKPVTKTGWLILNGQPVESDIAYQQIYSEANTSVFIIDNYISLKTLVLFKHIKENVTVTIFSDNVNNSLHKVEFEDFCKEFSSIEITLKKSGGIFHDRYIVIDYDSENEKIYHCGASSKDGGRKVMTITPTQDSSVYKNLIERILGNEELVLR